MIQAVYAPRLLNHRSSYTHCTDVIDLVSSRTGKDVHSFILIGLASRRFSSFSTERPRNGFRRASTVKHLHTTRKVSIRCLTLGRNRGVITTTLFRARHSQFSAFTIVRSNPVYSCRSARTLAFFVSTLGHRTGTGNTSRLRVAPRSPCQLHSAGKTSLPSSRGNTPSGGLVRRLRTVNFARNNFAINCATIPH